MSDGGLFAGSPSSMFADNLALVVLAPCVVVPMALSDLLQYHQDLSQLFLGGAIADECPAPAGRRPVRGWA
jgi:hypothetical protein